ncbi:MAG TPA: DUF6704 family protein [Pseudolysinimonas sp.]|nr:hypothetical protein [Schumannella sp.]HEV7742558.1 DUF6704 family protein [Pseudolysinimonas sp.]
MSDVNEPGHGNSPAAWVAVIIMLVAIAVGTVAFWLSANGIPLEWLVWGSVGLLVLGPIVGGLLSKFGYGVNGPRYSPKAHD